MEVVTVNVDVTVKARDGEWSALALNFPVLAYGDSPSMAFQRSIDAVTALLTLKNEQGVLSKYLQDRGVPYENVPVPLAATQQHYRSAVFVGV